MMTPAELAEKVIGTCDHIDVEEELGGDQNAMIEFDALAFICEGCGWWCSMDEANDAPAGFVCEECYEEDD